MYKMLLYSVACLSLAWLLCNHKQVYAAKAFYVNSTIHKLSLCSAMAVT